MNLNIIFLLFSFFTLTGCFDSSKENAEFAIKQCKKVGGKYTLSSSDYLKCEFDGNTVNSQISNFPELTKQSTINE